MDNFTVLNYRNSTGKAPDASNLMYGQIAIGYLKDAEALYIKNSNDEVVNLRDVAIKSVTYDQLKTLRDNQQLIPMAYYRITDYVTMTSQYLSARNLFDLIVQASAKDTLFEECRAAHHASDTYFSHSDLSAWKVWYCLDNDLERFAWANAYGKGVIYRLIDEFNNDLPYDFKNIKFVSSYTFNTNLNGSNQDGSLKNPNSCRDNIMLPAYTLNDETGVYTQILNKNIFSCDGKDDLNNKPDDDDETPTVEPQDAFVCYNNKFGYNSSNNTFNGVFKNNTFGHDCIDNTFDGKAENNIFGNNVQQNTFGDIIISNIFGNHIFNNTFEDDVDSNVFGNSFRENELCGKTYYNTFGNMCEYNKFGKYTYFCSIGNFVSNVYLLSPPTVFEDLDTGEDVTYDSTTQYVHILDGTDGTTINGNVEGKIEISIPNSTPFSHYVGVDSDHNLKIWIPSDNEADLDDIDCGEY